MLYANSPKYLAISYLKSQNPPPEKFGGGILSPHLAILLQRYEKNVKNNFFINYIFL